MPPLVAVRKAIVDRKKPLPITRQCILLTLPRSTSSCRQISSMRCCSRQSNPHRLFCHAMPLFDVTQLQDLSLSSCKNRQPALHSRRLQCLDDPFMKIIFVIAEPPVQTTHGITASALCIGQRLKTNIRHRLSNDIKRYCLQICRYLIGCWASHRSR